MVRLLHFLNKDVKVLAVGDFCVYLCLAVCCVKVSIYHRVMIKL